MKGGGVGQTFYGVYKILAYKTQALGYHTEREGDLVHLVKANPPGGGQGVMSWCGGFEQPALDACSKGGGGGGGVAVTMTSPSPTPDMLHEHIRPSIFPGTMGPETYSSYTRKPTTAATIAAEEAAPRHQRED